MKVFLALGCTLLLLAACTNYSSVTLQGDRAYFTKNTAVFGIDVASVDVCDIGSGGALTNCRAAEQ